MFNQCTEALIEELREELRQTREGAHADGGYSFMVFLSGFA